MKKKLWSLIVAVFVCFALPLFAYENTSDEIQNSDMEQVLLIMADRIVNGPRGANDAYKPEAWDCLELLAETVYSGDISTVGMTWNGLNFLYGEARNQKVLYPELKDAFTKFMTHVYNHRAQLEKSGGKSSGATPSSQKRNSANNA